MKILTLYEFKPHGGQAIRLSEYFRFIVANAACDNVTQPIYTHTYYHHTSKAYAIEFLILSTCTVYIQHSSNVYKYNSNFCHPQIEHHPGVGRFRSYRDVFPRCVFIWDQEHFNPLFIIQRHKFVWNCNRCRRWQRLLHIFTNYGPRLAISSLETPSPNAIFQLSPLVLRLLLLLNDTGLIFMLVTVKHFCFKNIINNTDKLY